MIVYHLYCLKSIETKVSKDKEVPPRKDCMDCSDKRCFLGGNVFTGYAIFIYLSIYFYIFIHVLIFSIGYFKPIIYDSYPIKDIFRESWINNERDKYPKLVGKISRHGWLNIRLQSYFFHSVRK